MEKQQFSGKNLEEALQEATVYFAAEKDLICYNIIQQPTSGFLSKLFNRSTKIEAWVETTKQDLQAAAREVVRQTLKNNDTLLKSNSPPLPNENKNKHSKQNKQSKENLHTKSHENANQSQSENKENQIPRSTVNFNNEEAQKLFTIYKNNFLGAFQIPNNSSETIVSENNVVIKVSDPVIESLLSKSDKLSLAFEHIFKRIAQKKIGDIGTKIILDAGTSFDKREEHLMAMAKSLADKVKKTGKSIVLSSKSSQERRIIHLSLDNTPGIATRSIGIGDKRKLVIYSTQKKENTKPSKAIDTKQNVQNKNSSHKRKVKKTVSQNSTNKDFSSPQSKTPPYHEGNKDRAGASSLEKRNNHASIDEKKLKEY